MSKNGTTAIELLRQHIAEPDLPTTTVFLPAEFAAHQAANSRSSPAEFGRADAVTAQELCSVAGITGRCLFLFWNGLRFSPARICYLLGKGSSSGKAQRSRKQCRCELKEYRPPQRMSGAKTTSLKSEARRQPEHPRAYRTRLLQPGGSRGPANRFERFLCGARRENDRHTPPTLAWSGGLSHL